MTIYALVENGVVVNTVEWDGTPYTPATDDSPAFGWSPPDGQMAVALPDGSFVTTGYTYDGNEFIAPPTPPAPLPTLAEKTAQRDSLSAVATNQIAILTDATDPDIVDTVDPADSAKLKAWKQYRVALSKLDLTATVPAWPSAPSA